MYCNLLFSIQFNLLFTAATDFLSLVLLTPSSKSRIIDKNFNKLFRFHMPIIKLRIADTKYTFTDHNMILLCVGPATAAAGFSCNSNHKHAEYIARMTVERNQSKAEVAGRLSWLFLGRLALNGQWPRILAMSNIHLANSSSSFVVALCAIL